MTGPTACGGKLVTCSARFRMNDIEVGELDRGSTLMTLRVSRGVTYDEGEAGAAREGRRIKIKVSYDATLVVVYYSSE